MKRIKIIILLIAMLLPFAVNAGLPNPTIEAYDATVVNPNGIDYYKQDYNESTKKFFYTKKGHFDANTKIKVTDEIYSDTDKAKYAYNKLLYISIDDDNSDDDNYVIIEKDINSVERYDKEYVPNDNDLNQDWLYKYDKELEVVTNAEVVVFSGPSITYKELTKISKNTNLKVKYSIGSSYSDPLYMYVEYNGVKGWINAYDKRVLVRENQNLIAFNDIKTKCGLIASGTKFESRYKVNYSYDITYENNGCMDIINSMETGLLDTSYDYTCTANKDISLYSKTPYNKSNLLTTIKKGESFKQITVINHDEMDEENDPLEFYVDYNGKQGFIKTVSKDTTCTYNSEEPTTTTKTVKVSTDNKETTTTGNQGTKNIAIVGAIIGSGVSLIVAGAIVIVVHRNKKNKEDVQ